MSQVAASADRPLAQGPPDDRPVLSPRTRRLLEAPILPTILRLAIPSIVVVMVQATSSTVDALFVASLGPDALAGVSLVYPLWMLMVTMSAGGFGGGVASAIARALGGGRRGDADLLAGQAVLMALAASAVFTVVPLVAGPTIFRALGGRDGALSAALTYSNLIFAGAVVVWLVNALASVVRGSGEMTFAAAVIVVGELLHLALAPTFIFGLGPIPALGVAGAALALIVSFAVRAVILAVYLLAGRSVVRLRIGVPRVRPGLAADILVVALPGAVNTILTSANVLVVTGLVGGFGTLALAGYGAGARLEYLQIPLVFGLGTALVTMVGTNVGAGNAARARRVAWTGAGLAAAVTGGVGLLFGAFPHAWIGQFSGEPEVVAAGVTYARIVGPTYGLFGLGLALYFAAQGTGRLIWPLVAGFARIAITCVGGWLVMTRLGGDLAGVFGVVAVAFAAYGVIQAATLPLAFARGPSSGRVDR